METQPSFLPRNKRAATPFRRRRALPPPLIILLLCANVKLFPFRPPVGATLRVRFVRYGRARPPLVKHLQGISFPSPFFSTFFLIVL